MSFPLRKNKERKDKKVSFFNYFTFDSPVESR